MVFILTMQVCILIAAIICIVAAVAPCVLPMIGFTAGGVAAGSCAAFWQSVIGSVSAGSLFALLQSIGAAGFGAVGIIIAMGSAIITFVLGLCGF